MFLRKKRSKDDMEIANEIADENYGIANRTLRTAFQVQNLGQEVNQALDFQEEQIDHVNDQYVELNENTQKGEEHMRSIRSVPGAILNSFTRHCCCMGSTEKRIEREKKKNRKHDSLNDIELDTLPIPDTDSLRSWNSPQTTQGRNFVKKMDRTDRVVAKVDEVVGEINLQAQRTRQRLRRHHEKLDRTQTLANRTNLNIEKPRNKLH